MGGKQWSGMQYWRIIMGKPIKNRNDQEEKK